MAKDYLEVYSSRCLRCSHLVEGAPRRYDSCHYTAGNTDCPAAEVRIVPTGKVRRAAALIKKARAEKDPAQEAKILESISKESDAFKHLLYELVG